jgi:hypothetical protein
VIPRRFQSPKRWGGGYTRGQDRKSVPCGFSYRLPKKSHRHHEHDRQIAKRIVAASRGRGKRDAGGFRVQDSGKACLLRSLSIEYSPLKIEYLVQKKVFNIQYANVQFSMS